VTGGSSAITFLALPEVFAQAPGGAGGRWVMMTAFFLGLSFAALTSMISTVELCVRNFVDHGIERNKAVGFTAAAIFLLGLPSTFVWIKMDSEGVAFPEFLEVQDHIWGYGLMFSGLFIAFGIWKYGYIKWRGMIEDGEIEGGLVSFFKYGMSGFRDDFINTGDNDLWVPRAWDFIMYFAFPILFTVLIVSYFGDLISSFDPWYSAFNPSNPHGAGIILLFWGVVGALFIGFNDYVLTRRPVYLGEGHWIRGLFDRSNWEMRDAPLFRNVPEGAEASIDTLPGGDDAQIVEVGEVPEGWEDVYGEVMDAELA
jgi:NSS family neurotransmitter:Na+ symporter